VAGYKFSHHQKIIQGLASSARIGLCLDTAHAYAAGYDLSTKEGLENTLDEIEDLVGVSLIKLIHLNDSKDKLGSHRDRHAHIGKGYIGASGMKRIVNHPRLKEIPLYWKRPKTAKMRTKLIWPE